MSQDPSKMTNSESKHRVNSESKVKPLVPQTMMGNHIPEHKSNGRQDVSDTATLVSKWSPGNCIVSLF